MNVLEIREKGRRARPQCIGEAKLCWHNSPGAAVNSTCMGFLSTLLKPNNEAKPHFSSRQFTFAGEAAPGKPLFAFRFNLGRQNLPANVPQCPLNRAQSTQSSIPDPPSTPLTPSFLNMFLSLPLMHPCILQTHALANFCHP